MRSLFFIISACLLLAGCIKIPGSEEKFGTIRGRLVQDCTLKPISGVTVSFATEKPSASIIGPARIEKVGETTTQEDGSFEIKLRTEDMVPLFVSYGPYGGQPYAWPENLQLAQVHDWGNVYASKVPVYINVVANIGPGLRAKDSLVINYKGRPIAYSPVPEQIHLNDVSYYINGPETDVSAVTPLIIRYSTAYNNINKDNIYGQVYTKAFEAPVYLCSANQVDTVSIDW